jgi:hypothetical protein
MRCVPLYRAKEAAKEVLTDSLPNSAQRRTEEDDDGERRATVAGLARGLLKRVAGLLVLLWAKGIGPKRAVGVEFLRRRSSSNEEQNGWRKTKLRRGRSIYSKFHRRGALHLLLAF